MDNQLRELRVDYKGKSYKLSVRLRPDPNSLVVFLHGWGCAKESFAEAFLSSALKGYGICTVDLLGFGKSDRPVDFSYDLLDHANTVTSVVNSLKAKKVYLVGHSMGGGIGLLAAPTIKNLGVFISAEGNLASNGGAVDARIAAKQPFWIFRYLILPALRFFSQLHPEHSRRAWGRWCRQASPWGLYKSVQSLAAWSDSGELLPRFKSLPQKAYIYSANGKRKKDVVPELDKSIAYEIPACDHALMLDRPDDFYATVAKVIRVA